MTVVGTSGYSFNDWKGVFYPEKIGNRDMLAFYKDHFSAVEINSTYYGIPKPEAFERMADSTPENFEFIVKVNRNVTHEKGEPSVHETFRQSVAPLKERGKLSGVLAQFPWGFRNNAVNRDYILAVADEYRLSRFFVEFRHQSWNRPEIFDLLKSREIGFVSVDEPQIGKMMTPDAFSTINTGYIRFHGRNTQTWWGKEGDRYDYDYAPSELEEWIEKVKELEKGAWKIYAFFNNCHKGYAVRNAMMFRDMMRRENLNCF